MEYTDYISAEESDPTPQYECSWYDTKWSDGQA